MSADLPSIARHRVAVVCAGAKAVLALGRTRELLETLGVPVYGFATDEFPAFYRRASGFRVDQRFDDVASLAAAVRRHLALELGGVVVGNPIPAEHELPAEVHDRALEDALRAARRDQVHGRDVTPFLLERMRVATDGRSVVSNQALLAHNARVAAGLAVALATP